MVTRLSDGRGQTTIKGHSVSDDWERLIRKAAERQGQTVADFITSVTTAAAQAILTNKPAVPAAVPARLEDVAADFTKQLAEHAARLSAEQQEQVARLEARQDEGLKQIRQELHGETLTLIEAIKRSTRVSAWRRR